MRNVPRPSRCAPSTSAPRAARCDRSPDGSSCSTPRSTSTTGRSRSCSTRQRRSSSPSAASATSPPPQFYIAWSHPGRCHSEAAFARLGGTSPVPGNLRPEPDPPSAQPRRRPTTQLGALHGRRHQAAMRPDHQGLHRPARRRGQDRTRSHPMRQALPRPPRLATPRTPTDPHLTDIEASPRRPSTARYPTRKSGIASRPTGRGLPALLGSSRRLVGEWCPTRQSVIASSNDGVADFGTRRPVHGGDPATRQRRASTAGRRPSGGG